MDKRKIQLGLIFAILVVTYNIVLFLVAQNLHTSFWVSYIFIMISILSCVISFFFVSNEKRKKQVVGMPVTVLSVLYFVCEFIMGTIFMFFDVSFAAVFVPQFVLCALFLICFIPALMSPKNYKTAKQEIQKTSTQDTLPNENDANNQQSKDVEK